MAGNRFQGTLRRDGDRQDYAQFADYFLAHGTTSLKNRHYKEVPDNLFFAAMDWLRKQNDLLRSMPR